MIHDLVPASRTPACGQCKGIACQNSPQVDREDFDDAADDETNDTANNKC